MKKIMLAAALVCGTMFSVGCGTKKTTQPQAAPVQKSAEKTDVCICNGNPQSPDCKGKTCWDKTCCGKEFKDCKCGKRVEK